MAVRAITLVFLASWCSVAYQRTLEIAGRPHSYTHDHMSAGNRNYAGCSKGFRYRFSTYKASTFEQSWKQELAGGKMDACSFIRSHTSQYRAWLDGIKVINNFEYSMDSPWATDVPQRTEGSLPTDIFSTMVYVNVCPGEYAGIVREILVEPLAGHLRHPLAHGVCKQLPGQDQQPISVMDLSHIRLNPWGAADLNSNFGGRRYLFDLGSSTFNSSLKYLTTRQAFYLIRFGHGRLPLYRQSERQSQVGCHDEKSNHHGDGICLANYMGNYSIRQYFLVERYHEPWKFDRLHRARTVRCHCRDYWASVPSVYQGRVHFYNVPITKDFSEASHPLNIIRSIYQPGDFVAVKLDIDNGPLELAIMKEIKSDPALISSIAEMMFEQHYDHEDMQTFFGQSNGASLTDTVNNFSELREAGLLLHYWP